MTMAELQLQAIKMRVTLLKANTQARESTHLTIDNAGGWQSAFPAEESDKQVNKHLFITHELRNIRAELVFHGGGNVRISGLQDRTIECANVDEALRTLAEHVARHEYPDEVRPVIVFEGWLDHEAPKADGT